MTIIYLCNYCVIKVWSETEELCFGHKLQELINGVNLDILCIESQINVL